MIIDVRCYIHPWMILLIVLLLPITNLFVVHIAIFCPVGNISISIFSILIIFWSGYLDIKIFWSAGETKRRGSNCGRHQGDCFYGENFHFLFLFHSFSSWLTHSLSMVMIIEPLWWRHQYPLLKSIHSSIHGKYFQLWYSSLAIEE